MRGGRVITDSLKRIELNSEEEKELIRTAHEKVTVLGHSVPTAAAQAAKERLLAAYSPAINRAAKVKGSDWDDLEAELILAFLRAIDEYDFQSNNRLSREIRFRLMAATREYQARQEAFTIPSQTRALFYSILYRHAGGSWSKALEILPQFEMTRETFVAIAEALHGVSSLSHVDRFPERPIWDIDVADFELVEFVKWLKQCLNEREQLLVDLHYGFDTEEASLVRLREGYQFNADLSIEQVASVMNIHTRTAWRVRGTALEKMREKIND
jgi:DNA-directed RNA polymerase specialized sigma subunit